MENVSGTYVAWNGREYPWPPPAGWEQRSDGRYWPVEQQPQPAPSPTGFTSRPVDHVSIFERPENIPPPHARDRVGPRPMRRRSIVALIGGFAVLVLYLQFVELDVLGFRLSQQDFAGFEINDEPAPVEEAPFGEERELSNQTKAELITVLQCVNDPDNGATLVGEVENPLDGDRTYLIDVDFFVDGVKQLDGFAETDVPAGEKLQFTARSASPRRPGVIACELGDVFRFIGN